MNATSNAIEELVAGAHIVTKPMMSDLLLLMLRKPGLELGEDYLVPDLAGWRRERLPFIEDDIHVVPDWICQIRSHRADTLAAYARHGASGCASRCTTTISRSAPSRSTRSRSSSRSCGPTSRP